MSVQSIIKKSIKRLELEGKLLTPDFYAEAFCKEAQKAGMQSEDCNHIEKVTKTLNKDIQKDLQNYRIKTMDELARFLVSKLNRMNTSICAQELESQTMLTKKILKVIEVLHNKEASLLAKRSIKLLNENPTIDEMDRFRQHWINFVTTYDDTFLNNLKSLGHVNASDLKLTIDNLDLSHGVDADNIQLAKISSLLISSFVPSIASNVNETIEAFSQKIKQNPSLLKSDSIVDEISSIISLRIALDKDSVKEMVESLDGVLDTLSVRLIEMIERSDNSTIEIQGVKTELEAYNENTEPDFKTAHKKLFTIATALEKNTKLFSKDLRNHSHKVHAMSRKVQQLEKELKIAKDASKEDFLTKLFNKRALDESMKIKEAEFERYHRNYSIVMFDLDHFKAVNDNYGHEAGDAILSAFGKILKKEARCVDIVGRFGGEEFMAILGNTDLEGGVVFAQKVRKFIQKSRFMYKSERINLTVSCGVAQRIDYPSLKEVLSASDKYMYKAKKTGRNKVASK